MSQFKTVLREAQKEIIEKKSRFIANVKPISKEEDAISYINSIKTKYWDARHNVYAYAIGHNEIQRYSDDGEPQGTAGIPTLQAIKNLGLQDVVVVITRYFGGILLGASGLTRAYGRCAKEGINEAQIITKKLCIKAVFKTDYTYLSKVQSILGCEGFVIDEIKYKEDVEVSVLAANEEMDSLEKIVANIINKKVDFKIDGEKLIILDSSNKSIGE